MSKPKPYYFNNKILDTEKWYNLFIRYTNKDAVIQNLNSIGPIFQIKRPRGGYVYFQGIPLKYGSDKFKMLLLDE